MLQQQQTRTNSRGEAYVIGPTGAPLTKADLPPPNTGRWVIRRKAEVVAAVRGGRISLEEALVRFRDRVQLEDVSDFVGAVLLCRVRGGNVATVMASIAEIIQDKIAIRQQILMLTAGKRAEANMVTFGPPAMVVLMGFLTPEYLTPLYEQLAGQVMLAVGTALLVAAFVIGRKVLEIEI